MTAAIGIDLGTTNSVVAAAGGGQVRILTYGDGQQTIPSVVAFTPEGKVLVGEQAREQRLIDAGRSIYSVKRLIGLPFNSEEVQRACSRFAFEMIPSNNGGTIVRVADETYTLTEISAFVLGEVRRVAEARLGEPCHRAVITVPANFNELQRSATKAAAQVAGLDAVRILNEPTAAALAYGMTVKGMRRVAVYDLGGGTFDISILEMEDDVFEVVATGGDSFLGGDDIDLVLAERMAERCVATHHWDPREDAQAFERLRAAAEWAKCELTAKDEVFVWLEDLGKAKGRSIHIEMTIRRDEMEAAIRPLIRRSLDVCERALNDAGNAKAGLDATILVGGSTRVPLVQSMVSEFFKARPLDTIDPDLVVAQGAAIHGHSLIGSAGGALRLVPLAPREIAAAVRERAERAARLPGQPAFAPRKPILDEAEATPVDGLEELPGLGAPMTAIDVGNPLGGPTTAKQTNAAPSDDDAERDSMLDLESMPTLEGSGLLDLDMPALPPKTPRGRHAPPAPPSPHAPPLPPPPVAPNPLIAAMQRKAPPPLAKATRPAGAPPPPPPLAPIGAPVSRQAGRAQPDTTGVRATGQNGPARASETEPSLQPFDSPSEPLSSPEPLSLSQPQSLSGTDFDADDFDDVHAPAFDSLPPGGFGSMLPFADLEPPSFPDAGAIEAAEAASTLEITSAAPLLMDVTPHSLGIETAGGYCLHLIRRNAPIPAEQSRVFSTALDGQESVRVAICQGEESRFDANQALGEVVLSNLPPLPRGKVQVRVSFMISSDGTLEVKAVDQSSGREQATRIDLLGGADGADIAAMRARHLSRYAGLAG